MIKKKPPIHILPGIGSASASDISQNSPGRYDNLLFWLTAAAATLGGFVMIHMPFVSGQWHVFHDNLIPATLYGMFYDRLFSGDSLLWSAALNGGHPLWVSFGAYPIIDPVALIVYAAAAAFGADWFGAYCATRFFMGL
ncbi:MAG: hypothetical protein V3S24_20455 [Candidatus Tectomicrobia bacterium]